MICKCSNILSNVVKTINAKKDSVKRAWELGGFYAVEEMDNTVMEIRDIISESYKICGCFDGVKLSKIRNIVILYKENKDEAGAAGGEHFTRMTKQGAYTEVLQIINE